MIIVSQDKKELVNFDNILSIKLFHDNEDEECLYEIYTTVNAPGDNYILIGTYATEERAKEILQEIINTYKFNRREDATQENAIYEMPNRWEDKKNGK